MNNHKKRPFTLIELMIGLALSAILLGFLFHFYTTLSTAHIDLAKNKEGVLSKQRVQLRLNQVLSLASEPFYVKEGALIFKYDNGIDPHPQFCGPLTGMLYVNEKKQLSLVTWSKEKEPRKEVLFPNVSSYAMSFFDPIEKKTWTSHWEKKLPAMTKLAINDFTLLFFMPDSTEILHYDKKL